MIARHGARAQRHTTSAGNTGEDGFTLIELLIVIVILPIIIGGIAAAVITSLNDQIGLQTKLGDSHDTQLTATSFGRDVQTALAITTNTSTTLCGTGTQLLGLKFQPTNMTTSLVSYVTTSSNPPKIARNFCGTGSPTTSAISHNVSSATPTLTASANSSSICTSFSAANTLVPSYCFANVALKITEKSGFSYSLAASPRLESAGSGGGPPPGPSLLLLGSGGSVINCQGGAGSLNINGVAAVNSSASGSINGSYALNASNLYSQSSTPLTTSPPGQAPTYNPATTQPQSMGPQIPDPYAALPDPSTSPPVQTWTTTNSLPGPGVYTNTQGVTINGALPTLTTGIYIFEYGLNVQGGGTITAPVAGVMFFIGIPNAPAGTPQPASYKVAGTGVVNLTAMSSSSSPYQGIAIFQARTDSNQLQVTGTSTASSYGGIIYAPDANVNTGGGGGLNSGGIVASSLSCGGGAAVTIGPSPSATATSITSTTNPTVSGQPASFTATVSAPGQFTPVGHVEFLANGTPIASCGGANGVALSNGQASCTTSVLVASGSPYTITATYLIPDPNSGYAWLTTFYTSSSGTVSQTVNKAGTATAIASNPNPSVVNQSVTYTATVSSTAPGSGTPTGNVEFFDGGTPITGCTAQGLLGPNATCTTSYAAAGSHTISAMYLGSTSFSPSTSSNLTQTVVNGVVPQISGFAEVPSGGSHQKYSGNTNVANGTITIDVCLGNLASCTSGWVKQYVITVSALSWSMTTTGADPLTSGATYTATASQVDGANVSSTNNPTITFTGN